jgi:hypothetical protein
MPAPEPYLTIRAVRPLVSGLQVMGHDPTPFLTSAGIDTIALGDPDARVPWGAVLSLIAHAVNVTSDPNLGLHIAEHAEPGSLDVHFYALLSSRTLGEGYQRLVHETTRIELNADGERATLRHVRRHDGTTTERRVSVGDLGTRRSPCYRHPLGANGGAVWPPGTAGRA